MKNLFVPQLLWKDYRLLRPLVFFVWVLAAVSYLVQPDASLFFHARHIATEMWILIPHLFALLAPLILLGTEQDSKTLGWLRQFPVRDRQIIVSRLCVALLGLFTVWIFCSANYWVVCKIAGQPPIAPIIQKTHFGEVLHLTRLGQFTGISASGEDSEPSILNLIYHAFQTGLSSAAWLLASYTLVQIIRQPVIASIPIVIVGLTTVLATIWDSQHDLMLSKIVGVGKPNYMLSILALIISLALINQIIARFQLKRKEDSPSLLQLAANLVTREKAPVPQSDIQQQRAWKSLLWQQYQQIRVPIRLWLGVIGFFLLGTIIFRRILILEALEAFFRPGVVGLVMTIASFSLGVLSFYQDNRHKTKAFLAERGVTPSFVWWTRVLPTLGAFVVIVVAHRIASTTPALLYSAVQSHPQVLATLFLFFASGVLISQSIEHPIFAFLVTPCHAFFVFSVLHSWAPIYEFTATIASTVLLYGSWRLTQRWMDGRINPKFAGSVIGYTTLATLPWVLLSLLAGKN